MGVNLRRTCKYNNIWILNEKKVQRIVLQDKCTPPFWLDTGRKNNKEKKIKKIIDIIKIMR